MNARTDRFLQVYQDFGALACLSHGWLLEDILDGEATERIEGIKFSTMCGAMSYEQAEAEVEDIVEYLEGLEGQEGLRDE